MPEVELSGRCRGTPRPGRAGKTAEPATVSRRMRLVAAGQFVEDRETRILRYQQRAERREPLFAAG